MHGACSSKLKNTCSNRRDPRSKVHGAKAVGPKQSVSSFFAVAGKAENQPAQPGQEAPAQDQPFG